MIVKITQDGVERDVKIKGLTGGMLKELFHKALAMQDPAKAAENAQVFFDDIDKIAAKITGLTVEELNDIDIEEKEKITNYIGEKLRNTLRFLNASMT